MAGTPAEPVTLEQYGELEVKVIKLRRALAHAQSVTKRQDAALSKTIDRLQTLDEEVKDLKEEGSRLELEILNLEDELEQRKNLPEMSQKDYTEKEIEDARKEIDELRFERAKVLVEIEKQKLCNRELGKTIEIVRKRYEHDDKKRRHETRKLEEKEATLKRDIDKMKREKKKHLGGTTTSRSSQHKRPSEQGASRRPSRSSANDRSAMSEQNQSRDSSYRADRSPSRRTERSSARRQSYETENSFGSE